MVGWRGCKQCSIELPEELFCGEPRRVARPKGQDFDATRAKDRSGVPTAFIAVPPCHADHPPRNRNRRAPRPLGISKTEQLATAVIRIGEISRALEKAQHGGSGGGSKCRPATTHGSRSPLLLLKFARCINQRTSHGLN